MEAGEIPKDFGLVGKMVQDICYNNAKDILDFDSNSPILYRMGEKFPVLYYSEELSRFTVI